MKKTLLMLMAIAFCTALIGQQETRAKSPLQIDKKSVTKMTPYEKFTKSYADQWTEEEETTPSLRGSNLWIKDGLIEQIGATYYTTPTNSCARNTISFRKDSYDAAAVWTMGQTTSNRGTGINYFDMKSKEWGLPPVPKSDRIESRRVGWGGHAFTKEGEIVVAHDAPVAGSSKGLVINTRAKWGQGEWKQAMLLAPQYDFCGEAHTALSWPTVVANGNTVHVFCVTESGGCDTADGIMYNEDRFPNDTLWGYKGYTTYPMYFRSFDGGITWEEPIEFPELGLMTPYETFKFGGDDYVITAKGNHIVILICTIYGLVYYLESFDNGDTWERHTVYHLGEVFLTSYEEEVGPVLLPRSGAVSIGDDETVHVAFTTCLDHRSLEGVGNYYAFPTGMVYWNSSMDELNCDDFTVIFDPEPEGDNHIINFEKQPGYIPLPSVVGLNGFYLWNGSPTYDRTQFGNSGWAAFARLFVKDTVVYLAYQAPLDYPLNFSKGGVPYFAHGIFVTVSKDKGATWNVMENTSWMNYDPEFFWHDWSPYTDEWWPLVDSLGDPIYFIGAVDALNYGLSLLTENGYPSMTINTKDDMLMLQWFNNFTEPFPFGEKPPLFLKDPIAVLSTSQKIKELPKFKNISEVYKNLWSDSPVIECVSDDGNTATITFKTPFYSPGSLETFNLYRVLISYDTLPNKQIVIKRDTTQITTVMFDPEAELFALDKKMLEEGEYYYAMTAVFYNEADDEYIESNLSCAYWYEKGENTEECVPHKPGTGVKDISTPPTLNLYPNPTNGNITIFTDADSPYNLKITNIMGQVVTSMNGISDKINLNVSNYAPGIYIVTIRTAKAMTSQKLIVR